jgi:drug/metabolite transporter (DMT)-like permease
MAASSPRLREDTADANYVSGLVLVLIGTVAFSSAGLFVRLLAFDAASTLFWRGVFTALCIGLFVVWREGHNTWAAFRAIGRPGLVIAAFSAASMGCFIASLQYTTVANNSIIFGTGPFLTAGLAWLLIGERPSVATVLCSLIAFGGGVIVLGSSFQLGAANLWGDVLAVLMTVTFALKTVLVRKHRDVPMVPSACVAAVLGSIGAAPFVEIWSPTLPQLGTLALFGFLQQGAGLILTTIGIGRMPAAHSALLMALDLPMSPLWVWLAFGETPAAGALVGGALVLAAIVVHVLLESRNWKRGSRQ